jgi:hypothetical protein
MHHFLTNHHYQRESVTILLANTDTTLSETNNHPRSNPLPRESRISLQINGPNMGETWLWSDRSSVPLIAGRVLWAKRGRAKQSR